MKDDVHASSAKATVWLNNSDGRLHDGRAIEYIITLMNGRPQSYQRTLYDDGDVISTRSSDDVSAVPTYVRDEVEKHCIPKGVWR